MFGKFFSSTFTGSMYGAGSDVFAVWGFVIANTVQSTIEINPKMVAAALGSTPDRVQEAIDYLCRPDPESRNSEQEGRRLIHQSGFQYHVVSHEVYRRIRNEEDRREYNSSKQRESRLRRQTVKQCQTMSMTVNDCQSMSTLSAHTEAEAEAEAEAEKTPPRPTPSEVERKSSNLPKKKPAKEKSIHPLTLQVKEAIFSYYRSENGVGPDWNGMEGKNLSLLLSGNPSADMDHWQKCIDGRAKSTVNHAERPGLWLTRLSSFRNPVNEYNRPRDAKHPAERKYLSFDEHSVR